MIDQSKWENILKFRQLTYKKGIENSFNSKLNQKSIIHRIGENDKVKAIDHLFEEQINLFKLRMSYSAMVFEFSFLKLNEVWPYWDIKPYSYALLSDNKALIDRYAYLPIDDHIIYKNPKDGVPRGFNYTVQGLLRENNSLIKRGLGAFQKDIDQKKSIGFHKAHIACTEAIASKDLVAIKSALQNFEKGRLKNVAVRADICENVISFFPIVYAKIAWMKGLEVDPQSKYMPLELLEVKPLEEYTIPYWFLRDYYREKGIDWRYDPIHPELQDWDNDPENPNRSKGGFFKNIFT